jgi:hypothetical protein
MDQLNTRHAADITVSPKASSRKAQVLLDCCLYETLQNVSPPLGKIKAQIKGEYKKGYYTNRM